MLKQDTLQFLETLKENNTREWFTENKKWYDRARADFEQLVGKAIQAIGTFDPEIVGIEPKKCIFRIYRDVRFSTDKSPYKTHLGAIMRPAGLGKTSGYYLHIDPTESFISCGHYMLEPDQLKKVRRGIYNDFDLFQEIVNEPQFKKELGDLHKDENEMLKRVPNGFDKDHPAAEYMKLKHFYVFKPFDQKELLSEDFIPYITKMYKLMRPLSEFLNDVLLEE